MRICSGEFRIQLPYVRGTRIHIGESGVLFHSNTPGQQANKFPSVFTVPRTSEAWLHFIVVNPTSDANPINGLGFSFIINAAFMEFSYRERH